MKAGVYVHKESSMPIIAWPIFRQTALPDENTSIPKGLWGQISMYAYHYCGVAVEGPSHTLLFNHEFFESNFEYVGEFE